MPTIKINNARFYYELHGSGEPLILIAGYTCDHSFWSPILKGLSKYFRVLIFDNRGVGQTTDKAKSLSAQLMARDVMSLAKKLKLEKPHIIGQSMGGTIAQRVASLYPRKIGKLVLLNTTTKWREAMLVGRKSALQMLKNNCDFDLIYAETIGWIFGESFLKDKKKIAAFKKMLLDNPYPQSIKNLTRQFNVLEKFNGEPHLKAIKAQTLIGYSTQDLLALPQESKNLANKISRSKLVEFDCGHVIMFEKPQQLIQTLVKYLKTNQE